MKIIFSLSLDGSKIVYLLTNEKRFVKTFFCVLVTRHSSGEIYCDPAGRLKKIL
jgi:hypothetical protein